MVVAPSTTAQKINDRESREESLEFLADHVDKALQVIETLDPSAKSKALDLKKAIETFHKIGLTKIVQRLKADPQGKALLFELVDIPEVYALLLMHGIVRPSIPNRVKQVIDNVRPYMQSHGGDVELIDVQQDTVFLRLHGACNGCSMSAVTLREGVEEALRESVPEIQNIEVLPNEPGPAMISLDSIQVLGERPSGWISGPTVDTIETGRPYRLDTDGTSIVILRLDDKLMAYRNECAHQGLPIDGGMVDIQNSTITCPWHGFCYDATSGECLSAPQAQLESFPLRVQEGVIWIRLPQAQ